MQTARGSPGATGSSCQSDPETECQAIPHVPRCSGCSKNALPGEAPRSLIPARAQRKRQGDPACLAAVPPTQLVPAPRVDEGATQTPQSALPGDPCSCHSSRSEQSRRALPPGGSPGVRAAGGSPWGRQQAPAPGNTQAGLPGLPGPLAPRAPKGPVASESWPLFLCKHLLFPQTNGGFHPHKGGHHSCL